MRQHEDGENSFADDAATSVVDLPPAYTVRCDDLGQGCGGDVDAQLAKDVFVGV